MNRIALIMASLGLIFISSCAKEEESAVFKSPITILQPSTDPANVIKGAPIKYDACSISRQWLRCNSTAPPMAGT